MKKVEVTWRDSRRYTYQMDSRDAFTVCTMRTLGFLVSKDKDRIVLSQEDIEGDYRGVIAIPAENITRIKHLR